MKFVHYQDCISPHQMPLARELANRVGKGNFTYLYLDQAQSNRVKMGWRMDGAEDWLCHVGSNPDRAERVLNECDVILIGYRDINLIERMVRMGKRVFVQGERWFKPFHALPGRIRLLHPGFRRMCRKFVELTNQSEGRLTVLPIGVHAMRDMGKLGVLPNRMMLWGYFVAPSTHGGDVQVPKDEQQTPTFRFLYVGRLLKLKRVDTIIRAFRLLNDAHCSLTIVGDGPEKDHLRRLAKGFAITFKQPIPVTEVRQTMREHNALVFASNARDGWGAVVSEALEEGLVVLASHETGAGATLLPNERQFKSGDVQALAGLMEKAVRGEFVPQGIGEWSAERAAGKLFALAKTGT